MFVDPGTLKGTPAVTTIKSFSLANLYLTAALEALTTAILNLSNSSVKTEWAPQVRHKRRAVDKSAVIAIIGTCGRSLETSKAVVPD